MTFLLDTNIAIDLRNGSNETMRRMTELGGPFCLSILTRIELENGVYQHLAEARLRRAGLDTLLLWLPVEDFDDADADAYRSIVEAVGFSRRKVLDRMIAAQALVREATLITRNAADFRDVPGLSLLQW